MDADGDGELTKDDFKILLNKFIEVCTYNLPSGAGFTGGLALGESCAFIYVFVLCAGMRVSVEIAFKHATHRGYTALRALASACTYLFVCVYMWVNVK
jgi:hypothetical protein